MEVQNPDREEEDHEEREGTQGRDHLVAGVKHRKKNRKLARAPKNKAEIPEYNK